MKGLVVAIDGPAGAGKSTVAKLVAQKMAYLYIDTGAMYRAVTWMAIQKKLIASKDGDAIGQLAVEEEINLLTSSDGKISVCVNAINITEAIRTPEVTGMVAEIAQLATVRKALTNQQRRMAANGSVIMDGRDIGTHVLPDADVKIFLTASIEERAWRRHRELKEKGYEVQFKNICEEIAARDKADQEREIAPLIQAADAIFLDTTGLSIDQVVERIIALCKEKGYGV